MSRRHLVVVTGSSRGLGHAIVQQIVDNTSAFLLGAERRVARSQGRRAAPRSEAATGAAASVAREPDSSADVSGPSASAAGLATRGSDASTRAPAVSVVLHGRGRERLEGVAERLRARASGRHSPVDFLPWSQDLSDLQSLPSSIDNLLDGTLAPRAFDSALLVHNAADVRTQVAWEQPPEAISNSIDLNVSSFAILSAKFVSGCLEAQTPVAMVNVSSVANAKPYDCFSIYGAGKVARSTLMASYAEETRLRGLSDHVRVMSYAPGPLDTEMQHGAREGLPNDSMMKGRFEEMLASGSLVDPMDTAGVLLRILEEDGYENGAHLDYFDSKGGYHPFAMNE